MLTRLLLCVSLTGIASAADVTVRVDLARISSWRVNPQIFGTYQEEHWGDISPGVYEQYLVNPSFEPWYETGDPAKNKTRLVFKPPHTEGVAYPWEPWGEAVAWSLSNERVNSAQSQRIDVRDGRAGIMQQLALPDYRTGSYRLRVYVRVTGDVKVRAILLAGSRSDTLCCESPLPADTSWAPAEVGLVVRVPLKERYLGRYGIARLVLMAEGTGSVCFDQATLFPADCVDGIYNPETLAQLARLRPTAVRWPGGNFTSAYHWRDGIGPVDGRPSRPNRAWGGTVSNQLGTDEWLRFCEIAKLEPVMGVGFGEITVKEAADWVEYCNGSTATPMGALRAANGRSEAYRVKYWGIGNEVYSAHQIGNTDAATYAHGFVAMAKAMKARDPSIVLIASGLASDYDLRGQKADWNRKVLEIAGPAIDLLDVHHYVRLNAAGARHVADDELPELRRAMLGSSARLESYYAKLRALLAARSSTRGIGVVHYEWGVMPTPPTGVVPPPPTYGAARQTFLNALATATYYNTFFRNGDLVRGAMLHNFSIYVNPIAANSEPPNPRTEVSRLYRAFAGTRLVASETEGPHYDVERDYPDIGPLHGIAEVDAVALLSDDGQLHVSLLNRNLDRGFDIILRTEGYTGSATKWSLQRLESDRPFVAQTWAAPQPVFRIEHAFVPNDRGVAHFTLPKGSITILTIAQR